ncbi:MAG: hypothetical protein V4722_21600 [Bacteroidota bacterium]
MPFTKEDIKAMTMEQRMALIDMIWEVTDEENPAWKDERSEDEILADGDEAEPAEPPKDGG